MLPNEEAVLLRVARAQVRLQSRCLLDQASQYSAMQVRMAAHCGGALRFTLRPPVPSRRAAFAGIILGSRHPLGQQARKGRPQS